uniref:Uncharacterized protein n=1 Tax=Medicago truncatula TaxID=3880 RepID=A2Q2F0_MEDTR|nr:hypothetical protein MtrDRAFT_AC150798g30v2 [Medicago truncatula]
MFICFASYSWYCPQILTLLRHSKWKIGKENSRKVGREIEMANHSILDSFVKIPTIKFKKLFINGEFVDSVSGFFSY